MGNVITGINWQKRTYFIPQSYSNKTEKKCSTDEKDLAVTVWGIKHFRPYLYGTKLKTVIDHKFLTWIMSVKDPGSRLLRWCVQLEKYDYGIVYTPGVQNSNADELSIGTATKECGEFHETDPDMKVKILLESHDLILGGHRGMNRTYEAKT